VARIAGVVALIALFAALRLVQLGVPGDAARNPQLAVVPTLREWHGDSGYFRFHAGLRIILDSADAAALDPTARTIQDDLASLTGANVELRIESRKPATDPLHRLLEDHFRSFHSGRQHSGLTLGDPAAVSTDTFSV
jgi:hypothetical protein